MVLSRSSPWRAASHPDAKAWKPGSVGAAAGASTGGIQYDKLQRLTREDLPGGGFNAYTYDNVGNLASLQDQQGAVTYTHTDSNLLETATFQVGSSDRTTTYTYDSTGQRDTMTLPNGVVVETDFDGAGRMTRLKATSPASVVHAHLTYSYAMPGTTPGAQTEQLRTQTDHVRGQTTTYTYDALNRVDVVTLKRNSDQFTLDSWDYAYDDAGNITRVAVIYRLDGTTYSGATTYAYNQANQVCWHYSGTATPSCGSPPQFANSWYHDANGNLIRTSDTSASTYNAKNQTLGLFGSNNFTFLGAGQDELISYQAVHLQNNALGVGLVDSQRIIRDDQGGLIGARDTSSHYYITDHLGSVIARSAQNGDLIEAYDYGPYGADGPNTTSQPPSFGFAGGYRGPSSDAYHFGARFYHPRHQRWTQQDPINQASDLRQANRYAYAGGDPINVTDPSGNGIIDTVRNVFKGGNECYSVGVGLTVLGGAAGFASGGPIGAAAGARVGATAGVAYCAIRTIDRLRTYPR